MSGSTDTFEDHNFPPPPSIQLDPPFAYNPPLPFASDLSGSSLDSLFGSPSELQPTSPAFSPFQFDFETLPPSPDFNIPPFKTFESPKLAISGEDATLLSNSHLSPYTAMSTSNLETAENSLFDTATSQLATDKAQFQDFPATSPLSTDFFSGSTAGQNHPQEPDLQLPTLTPSREQQALTSLFDTVAQGHTLNHPGFTPIPTRHQTESAPIKNPEFRRDNLRNFISAGSHHAPFTAMTASNSPSALTELTTHKQARPDPDNSTTTHQPDNNKMAPHNPPPEQETTNPFLSSHPTTNDTNTTPPPPQNLPSTSFPTPLPPPNIPIRLPPLLDSPILSGTDLLLSNSPSSDEARNNVAYHTLMTHKKERTPYVLNASERLQAVLGLRNEVPFTLPEAPSLKRSPLAPALKGLGIEGLGLGLEPRGVKRDHDGAPTPTPTAVPMGMSAEQGLREFLLQRGKEGGMKKVQCSSMTFHDFTPDLRTHAHQNKILGHFVAERGCRVDYYEVDLPAEHTDPTSGAVTQTSETWIWFLLSRPMLTHFVPVQPKTPVMANEPFTSTQSGYTEYYTPPTTSTSHPGDHLHPAFQSQRVEQPNLPSPIPTSSVIFALPKAHCTTYPIRTEDFHAPTYPKKENIPFRHPYDKPLSSMFPSLPAYKPKSSTIVNKRTDIDLSFSGLPIFEFSPKSTEYELSTWSSYITALSTHPSINNLSTSKYEAEISRLEKVHSDGIDGFWLSVDVAKKGFNEGLVTDVEKWQDIKACMGRGKCRLVLRWSESKVGVEDGEALEGLGMGLGGEIGATGGFKRTTRSQSRNRSALSMEMGMGGGVLIGVGMPTRGRTALAERKRVDIAGHAEETGIERSEEMRKAPARKARGRKR